MSRKTYIKLFEGGVGHLLVITVDLARLIVAGEGAEDAFKPLKLRCRGGGGKNEEKD